MQATALSATLTGLDAHLVRVEVDSGRGVPVFHIVGLPEASVRESRVRVRAALSHFGVEVNQWVLSVNLAPADLRKSGCGFDAAIAAAVLAALGKLPPSPLAGTLLLGELSLTGELRPVRGVLPAVRSAALDGIPTCIVAPDNAAEAAIIEGIRCLVAPDLQSLVGHFAGTCSLEVAEGQPYEPVGALDADLADVRGQSCGRRALEVAAAGGHSLLMMGPPGSGKTMLARRLPGLLPPLSLEEALEVTAIHSVAGLLPRSQGLVRTRPFRAPHHTVSTAGLLGGGDPLRPGEMSLAHGGCLFLDELYEFSRPALEGMRQPLESGKLTICRARNRAVFPAAALLVAAANPCPCGWEGHPFRRCACPPGRVAAYKARLSGPLRDRIDLQILLEPVELDELRATAPAESSAVVQARVLRARERQAARAARGVTTSPLNATLSHRDALRVAPPDAETFRMLRSAAERLGLSARAYVKLQRIARTLADLADCETARVEHFAEALELRQLDQQQGAERQAASAS